MGEDVIAAIKSSGMAISKREILSFMVEADANGNGDNQIDVDEYLLLVSKISDWALNRLEFALSLLVLMLALIICSVVLPVINEGWGKADGFYFSVITWTTIGLGDFVPAHMEGSVSSH